MKKFIVCVLLVLMLVPSGLSEMENFDVSSLSDGQLLTIYEAVEQEVGNRGLKANKKPIATGAYVVGKDIAPGKYVISQIGDLNFIMTIEKFEGAEEKYDSDVSEYKSSGMDNGSSEPQTDDYYMHWGFLKEPTLIELLDGNVLTLEGTYQFDSQQIMIEQFNGLFMDTQ